MSKHPPDNHSIGRPRLRERLADPRLISWPTFAICSALLAYEIWLYDFADFALSQIIVFAFLTLARWLYLSLRFARRHASVMLATVVLSSVVGTTIAQLLLAQGDAVVVIDGAFTRMIAIPAAGLLSISLIDYRDKVRDLRETAQQLEATRDAGLVSLATARDEIVGKVQSSLERSVTELRGGDPYVLAKDLSSLAQDTVRPLSHELAQASPRFAPATVPPQRIRWSMVLSDVASQPVLIPWLMALASAIVSIRFTFAQSDTPVGATLTTIGPLTVSMDGPAVLSSVSFLLIVFVAMWVLTALAVRLSRPILARASAVMRWITTAASVVGIGIGLQLVLLVVPTLPGPLTTIDIDPIGRFVAFLPVVIIALALALARTVSFARTSIIDQLAAVNTELDWEVARIRLDLWAQQRSFAQAIHGPLQAAITASALLLTNSEGADRRSAIEAAHDRIKEALDNLVVTQDSHVDLDAGLTEIERTWDGVCEVSTDVSAAANDLLEHDATCRQATVMVIGESVANAAIHGKATRTDVRVMVNDTRFIEVSVHDNGSGSTHSAVPGFGSVLLDEACGEWHLTNTPEGARLIAVLPVATTQALHA